LLKENTESVLHAARRCGADLDPDTFDEAVHRKRLPARDILFTKISNATHRDIRTCVLAAVPSIAGLVAALVRVVLPALAAPQQVP
jgi:hypothetical protein